MLVVALLTSALAAPAPRLTVAPVPEGSADPSAIIASSQAWIDGKPIPFGFQELIRTGDQPGKSPHPFGRVFTESGELFQHTWGPYTDLCNQADFTALQESHGKLWLWTHQECMRGEIYLTELSQDPTTGALSAVHTQPVGHTLSHQGGVYDPCAGDITSWGTLLSSEEYEPDARSWDPDTGVMADSFFLSVPYNQFLTAFAVPQDGHPYRYGWVPELTIGDATGTVSATKHYSMGRFSHEVARVMPDQRTVYLSDDGYGVGFFMYVADKAGDLSTGTLYAAQWSLDYTTRPTDGSLTWVSLGHATDEAFQDLVNGPDPAVFSDLFVAHDKTEAGKCPAGSRPVLAFFETECLSLAAPSAKVADPALAASRLESRRYAGWLGATVELMKAEGIASGPDGEEVYLALSYLGGFGAEGSPDDGAPDTLRVERNECGGVFAGATMAQAVDATGVPIDSAFVMRELRSVLEGAEQGVVLEGRKRGRAEACAPSSIANPDNITFLDGYDQIAIAEDSRRASDALWLWDRRFDTLTRILYSPPVGEVSGITMSAELGGFRYLTVSLQGPGPEVDTAPFDTSWTGKPFGSVEGDTRSVVGVFGPFPPKAH